MVTIDETGLCRFRVYVPGARLVELVGDFTGWRQGAIAMRRDGGGWWAVEVAAPPGDRAFQYLVDGVGWIPDYAAQGLERNGFGTWVSLLHVPRPEAPPALRFAPPAVPRTATSIAA